MARIVVDPGHGGQDRGGKSLVEDEADLVLRYSQVLGRRLTDLGHEVLYTRLTDDFVTIQNRYRLANDAAADLFVSVHANASANPEVRGPWTIFAQGSRRGEYLASIVQGAMAAVMGGNTRAYYPDMSGWVGNRRLGVLHGTSMPAILLEIGFMTNMDEAMKMAEDEVTNRLCEAVAGVIDVAYNGRPNVPERESNVVEDAPHVDVPYREVIDVPRVEDIIATAQREGLTEDRIRDGLRVAARVALAVSRGRRAALEDLVGVIEDYLSR